MKLQRKIAAGAVVASSLLLVGVLVVEFLSAPRNAVSAAAVFKRSWPGEQSSSLVSALLDAAGNPALLDAAAQAGSSCLDIRHQLQLQQHAFCLRGRHEAPLPGTVGVQFGNVTMWVYGGGDIVSDQLRASRMWEWAELDEWLWAIRQWKPQPLAAANAPGDGITSSAVTRPLAVDIGANVGWFALNAAAAGARVAAFEAMPANIALIRRTLCASPWLADRIALYNTGLGEEPAECHIISGTGNRGDGFIQCDKQAAYNTPGYEVRGTISLRRLDTFLDEDVQVLKVDVEGYEQKALTGAQGLLSKHRVHYIMAECNTGIIGEEGGKRFIQFLHEQGYEVSPFSFQGPFWGLEQIQDATCSNINLYARRRAPT